MGRKKNLKGIDTETMDIINEKFNNGYYCESSVNYVSRNKSLDYKIFLKSKNKKQEELINEIKHKEITFCSGSAGTGKSYIAMAVALDLIRQDNQFKKITLIVPTVQSDIELGFLKGSLEEKIFPHAEPHLYTMEKIINKSGGNGKIAVEMLRKNGLLDIKPVSFLRGATLDEQIILIEESQNLPVSAFKTILTRLGDNCKMVFLGDIDQIDNKELRKKGVRSGLDYAIEKLSELKEVGTITFNKDEIVRNPLISKILDNWE